jgi:hypothetical protein
MKALLFSVALVFSASAFAETTLSKLAIGAGCDGKVAAESIQPSYKNGFVNHIQFGTEFCDCEVTLRSNRAVVTLSCTDENGNTTDMSSDSKNLTEPEAPPDFGPGPAANLGGSGYNIRFVSEEERAYSMKPNGGGGVNINYMGAKAYIPYYEVRILGWP